MYNFRQDTLTPVVKNIIIINVLFVLLQFVLGQKGIDLADYLALHYWRSPNFGWWQLFTHMFMHGSAFDIKLTIGHIFFNMFGLFMFGGVLEQLWGPKRFLLFYLICGVGAALCQLGVLAIFIEPLHASFLAYQQHPDFVSFAQLVRQHDLTSMPRIQEILRFWELNRDCGNCSAMSINALGQIQALKIDGSMVGASGAVMGILFGFAYLFPNIELFIMFIPVPVKAKFAIAGYALIELFSGIGNFAGDNVAHFAHLGGMLFAFIILRIWNNNIRNRFY
jgi:membrane associated rhomboid family serine protease